MRWARRVTPSKIRRLYKSSKANLLDTRVLDDVGSGLHARCLDVLKVVGAYFKGEVPCPECGETVHREARRAQYLKLETASEAAPKFPCRDCRHLLSWLDCREALRHQPKCFDCLSPLTWRYADNTLSCPDCAKTWTWKQYRESVSRRLRLPCPHCGHIVRRPDATHVQPRLSETAPRCPRCGETAVHTRGKLSCPSCGYETAWSRYRERMRRRTERLKCPSCGHGFTWNSWRRTYSGRHLLTGGNKEAIEQFARNWPRSSSPDEKMTLIDTLLHAVHGHGALGPLLIDADESTVMRLLDDLAAN